MIIVVSFAVVSPAVVAVVGSVVAVALALATVRTVLLVLLPLVLGSSVLKPNFNLEQTKIELSRCVHLLY